MTFIKINKWKAENMTDIVKKRHQKKQVKQQALVLSYINLFSKPLDIEGLQIKTAKYKDILANYEESQLSMYGGEFFAITKKRHGELKKFEESKWVFIIKNNKEIDDACYLGMLDLCTNNWRYILKRNESLKTSSLSQPINWNPPSYNLTPKRINRVKQSLDLINKKGRFRVALQRWFSSYNRSTSYLDSLLDCCSALEALLGTKNEIRLRISLYAYYLLQKKKRKFEAKKMFKTIYKMYGLRNEFTHGSKIPKVKKKNLYLLIEAIATIINITIDDGKIPEGKKLNDFIFKKI